MRGFLWFYFVNEHFLRFLNKRVPRDYDTVPLLLFWALLVLWLIPWTAFLPQSLQEVPRRWHEFREQMSRRQHTYLLCFLWNVVIVGFFSFSTRQEYYTIPAIPGMALLVGGWLQRERTSMAGSRERRAGRISSAVLLVVGWSLRWRDLRLLFFSKVPAPGTDLSDLLRKNPQDYALSFGHFLDLTPQAMGAFRLPLFLFSLAFLVGTLANWMLRRAGRVGAGNSALVLMMVVVLACVRIAFGIFSPIISSKDLAMAIRAQYRPGDQVVATGLYENASTSEFLWRFPAAQSAHARRKHVVRRSVPRCASRLGDAGLVCDLLEWPGASFLVDRSGRSDGAKRADKLRHRAKGWEDDLFESAECDSAKWHNAVTIGIGNIEARGHQDSSGGSFRQNFEQTPIS